MRWLLAFLLAVTAQAAAAATPVERHGQLRVEGNRVVDKAGKPVTLRGMSLFWSQWMPQFYNRQAVDWLVKDWKVTVVRAAVAVDAGGYMRNPEAEKRKAEAVIDAAIANGIYVIVDWHAHEPHPNEAAKFFGEIAAKYGAYPNVIYETYNEPLPKHGWKDVLKPYHAQVNASIRAHDPDNIIVAGTRSWSQDVDEAAADPLEGSNIAYTLHFYAGTHKQPLRDKALKAMQLGAALMVTEWGTTEATGDDRLDFAESKVWLDFMEANGLSHANWSIADKDELSAALKPRASGHGGWREDQITESGRWVRAMLREKNSD